MERYMLLVETGVHIREAPFHQALHDSIQMEPLILHFLHSGDSDVIIPFAVLHFNPLMEKLFLDEILPSVKTSQRVELFVLLVMDK